MGRNRHDGTGTIAGKHILGNPYRHLVSSKRIDCVRAGEDSCHISCLGNPFTLSLLSCHRKIFCYSFFLLLGSEFFNPFTFRSKYHESYTEHCICTCGEDCHVIFSVTVEGLEYHFRTLTATNPVALHVFQRVCPFKILQIVKQTSCISRYSELPLGHLLLLDRMASTYGIALLHLIIGEDGSKSRAPVDRGFTLICNTIAHQDSSFLLV